MSRHDREAKLEALYGGGPDGMVLVTEHGGRKRDARKTLQDRMSKMMARPPSSPMDSNMPSDAPMLGSFRGGTLGQMYPFHVEQGDWLAEALGGKRPGDVI